MDKRRIFQIGLAIAANSHIIGFFTGRIYRGKLKMVCTPGLNCYSCPGALGACPIGSLQSGLSSLGKRIPIYILGFLALFGILFGRMICSYACPFGLIQELLHKIPSVKLKKSRVTRRLSLLKYIVLAVFVVAIPIGTGLLYGMSIPGFCKYICPAGTLEAGLPLTIMNAELRESLGFLFNWKLAILLLTLIGCVFVFRPFCRFICPLGAIYSFFNKYAIFGIKVNENCVNCKVCTTNCQMDTNFVNDRECIRCGTCRKHCKFGALD